MRTSRRAIRCPSRRRKDPPFETPGRHEDKFHACDRFDVDAGVLLPSRFVVAACRAFGFPGGNAPAAGRTTSGAKPHSGQIFQFSLTSILQPGHTSRPSGVSHAGIPSRAFHRLAAGRHCKLAWSSGASPTNGMCSFRIIPASMAGMRPRDVIGIFNKNSRNDPTRLRARRGAAQFDFPFAHADNLPVAATGAVLDVYLLPDLKWIRPKNRNCFILHKSQSFAFTWSEPLSKGRQGSGKSFSRKFGVGSCLGSSPPSPVPCVCRRKQRALWLLVRPV